MKTEVATEAAKAAPPVAVTAFAMAHGLTLNEIVALVTLGYIVLQAGYLLWKWRQEYRRSRQEGKADQ